MLAHPRRSPGHHGYQTSTQNATAGRRHARYVAAGGVARLPLGIAVAAVVTACLVPHYVLAQNYKSDPFDDRVRLKLRTKVTKIVKNPSEYATSKETVEQLFTQYYFPIMTQAAPDDLARLGKLRYEFFKNYVWPSRSEALQKDLTTLAFAQMKRIIPDRGYHPAVRYNAILLMGMLDARYAIDSGSDARPPVPLSDGTKVLLQVVKLAGKNVRITPGLLVGALVGLERHAKYHHALPPAIQAELESTMLNLLAAESPPFELDSDVADWIQRQAATVLANLGKPGENNRVLTALTNVYADDEMVQAERAQVAALLRNISFSGVEGDPIARSMVELTDQIAKSEADRARQFQKDRLQPGRRRMARPRNSGIGQDEFKLERRQLIADLGYLTLGLAAVEPASTEPVQAKVATVRATVTELVRDAQDEDVLDLDLVDRISNASATIDGILLAWDSAEIPAAVDMSDEAAGLDAF